MTDDEPDDATLVRATLDGRADAFARLYDRYAPLVRAVCFDATGGRDLSQAQDLAQEAFLRAYRKLARLRVPAQFGPWVVGIARHVGREWRRGTARRLRHLHVAGLEATRTSGTPDGRVAGATDDGAEHDDLPRLRQAIAALPDREREALHLFYLQAHPAEVAAGLLGMSRSGFYRALDRATRRLRRTLGLDIRGTNGESDKGGNTNRGVTR
jgi:RNA polymerase sigma-70 factor (ECF subfamily)